MIDKIFESEARLLERNYKPRFLRLTPHDYDVLLSEIKKAMNMDNISQIKCYLDLDIIKDGTIFQSRLEMAYPYSLMDEGKQILDVEKEDLTLRKGEKKMGKLERRIIEEVFVNLILQGQGKPRTKDEIVNDIRKISEEMWSEFPNIHKVFPMSENEIKSLLGQLKKWKYRYAGKTQADETYESVFKEEY